MTERSWYWAGTTLGDAALPAPYGAPYSDDRFSDNYAKLFTYNRATQGVLLRNGTYGLIVTNPAGATIRTGTGLAIVDGKIYENDGSIDTTPGNGDWLYLLRKTWATQEVRATYKAYAALTQVDGATWEIPLARVTIAGGVVTLLQDQRSIANFAGSGKILLARTVIVNDGDFVTWSGISQLFSHLLIIGQARSHSSGGGLVADDIYLQFNGDVGANYDSTFGRVSSSGGGTETYLDYTAEVYTRFSAIPAFDAAAGYAGSFEILIPNYRGTTFYKLVKSTAVYGSNVADRNFVSAYGIWKSLL